jgi:hypothetical protein
MLSLKGDFATDVRPARNASGRKAWAKDPSTPLSDDGTRLDATFVNDLIGLLNAALNAYGITPIDGDDSLLAQAIAAAVVSKAPVDSPTFTGNPKAPTPLVGGNDTSIATTAFVATAIANLVNSAPGTLDTLNELAAALGDDPNYATTIATALGLKAPLSSPAFTDTPTAPTAAIDDNTTQIATTAFVVGQASSSDPAMDGSAAAGMSKRFARADHVHPSDTSKVSTSQVGAASGVAPLDSNSRLPNANLTDAAAGNFGNVLNATLAASVSGNALTISLKTYAGADPSAGDKAYIPFRNSLANSGAPAVRSVTSALSVTIPAGQAVGTVNNRPSRLWIVAIDNGGTVELAVVNCLLGGASPNGIFALNEANLISTTAIATAPSAGVFYSTAARTAKPFRILGYVEYGSGLAIAGTWASAPTTIQQFGPGVHKPGDILQTSIVTPITATSTTSTSYVATALTCAITPSSPANLMEALAVSSLQAEASVLFANAQLFRDSTGIGTRISCYSNAAASIVPCTLLALDLPGGAATYTVKLASGTSGQQVDFNNTGNGSLYLKEIMT